MIMLLIAVLLLAVIIGGVVWAIREPTNRTFYLYARTVYRNASNKTEHFEHFVFGVIFFSKPHVHLQFTMYLQDVEQALRTKNCDHARGLEVLRHMLQYEPWLVLNRSAARALDDAQVRGILDKQFMPITPKD